MSWVIDSDVCVRNEHDTTCAEPTDLAERMWDTVRTQDLGCNTNNGIKCIYEKLGQYSMGGLEIYKRALNLDLPFSKGHFGICSFGLYRSKVNMVKEDKVKEDKMYKAGAYFGPHAMLVPLKGIGVI